MSQLDILRRVTKPMTDVESEALVRARYGSSRENVSSDDTVSLRRAQDLLARGSGRDASPGVAGKADTWVGKLGLKG